ncbi:colicin E3/pyocin S6 family cytotoxin [Prevotella nigrescens]
MVLYRDAENRYYTFDTQHGRFEYLGERGKHLGEFYIDGNQTKEADKKGK